MTGDVVNLRRVRKAKARTGRAEQAAENRIVFGRTRAEREVQTALAAKATRLLDGHHLGRSDTSGPAIASDDA